VFAVANDEVSPELAVSASVVGNQRRSLWRHGLSLSASEDGARNG
jgi:hypothetical protein